MPTRQSRFTPFPTQAAEGPGMMAAYLNEEMLSYVVEKIEAFFGVNSQVDMTIHKLTVVKVTQWI